MESPQHSGSQRRVLFGRLLYREVVHVKPPARCGRHHRRCRVALLPQRRQELGPVGFADERKQRNVEWFRLRLVGDTHSFLLLTKSKAFGKDAAIFVSRQHSACSKTSGREE
ncbi:hypothetical protein C4D60_Mb08t17920 [Musa balbisiana]|uniref:Uncharacterized protein n=1 Tax=Musa balbisiana TaxID=52838 RepID=A0A4S8K4K9_MUSBA|nr:hypothetical protein C4D60_Mb08t17920 [Musa balbisiana]